MISLSFEGADAMVAEIRAARAAAGGPELRQALVRGAQPLLSGMQARVHRLSGALEAALEVREAEGAVEVGPSPDQALVGSLLEYGHIAPNWKGGGFHHVPAYPWSRPAFDAAEGQMDGIVQEAAGEVLDRAVA